MVAEISDTRAMGFLECKYSNYFSITICSKPKIVL